MPSLSRCLRDYDLGFLRIIAESAGLEPPPGNRSEAAGWLEDELLRAETLNDNLASLSPDGHAALQHLLTHGGRQPMPDFSREFGVIRDLGPARRDREQPWRDPISATEALWYHALIGRAFLDTPSGPQEYVYIPDELYQALGAPLPVSSTEFGVQARTPQVVISASSAIVDDATTLLAYFRRLPSTHGQSGQDASEFAAMHFQIPPAVRLLESMLRELALIQSGSSRVDPDATRSFLALDRASALRSLIGSWRSSTSWNDLAALPHLRPSKDGWPNNPLQSRLAILAFLASLPTGVWWEYQSFVDEIQHTAPGFQRPAGNFDSWYLRDSEGRILSGLEAWDRVEGALLRYVIQDVLHWLGVIDLGLDDPGGTILAFRLSPAAGMLFERSEAVQIQEKEGKIQIDGRGLIQFARSSSRPLRYQIARFAHWIESDQDQYRYALTPESLQLALEQGLQVRQVRLLLLECGASVPPSLLAALDRWGERGLEARIEHLYVLRTESEELMQELRATRGTKRYLQGLLGPKAALVAGGDVPRLLAAATRAGIFISAPDQDLDPE